MEGAALLLLKTTGKNYIGKWLIKKTKENDFHF